MKLFSKINLYKLAVTALLFATMPASGQLTTRGLEEKFNFFRTNSLQEKIYMHLDRNAYLAGEILWFRLYLVDASFHQPLDLSKVAYVEVLDESNTPVMQAKLVLDNGKGNGSLAVPASVRSGNYKIRAYTNWMKNLGPDYFFEKMITVVNTQKSREIVTAVALKTTAPDISIFPEGGDLVQGIASTVACKVTGGNGKGADYSGTIVDENNRSVASFKSLVLGMGRFSFVPEAGHTYKAVIETANGRFTKELPRVFSKGYVMSLRVEQTFNVSVQSNVGDGEQVFLLVHTRQALKTVMQSSFVNGRVLFMVDPSKVGEGISQFTVISSTGKPLCERLYFSYPAQKLSIGVNGNLPAYGTRSKVDFELRPVAQNSKSPADMSVSVYRADELQLGDNLDIQTFLWLSSDLKGYIESPSFYFNGSAVAKEAMDNLMLTQGWRRFKWDDVLQGKMPVVTFAPEHSGHIITGKVVSSVTGKPQANLDTYLSVPGRNSNFRTAVSDSLGQVKFDIQHMRGSSEVIVQTDPSAEDTLARIEINNPFSEQYTAKPLPPFYLPSAKENLLREQNLGVQVQNTYAGTKLKTFFANTDTSGVFFNSNGKYMLDDYTRFTTMEEVLREYVGLMNVKNRNGKFSLPLLEDYDIPIVGMGMTDFFPSNPLVLVDGVPVFNMNKVIAFDPLKLRKLETYNKRYYMGEVSYPGILNFTTYKGDFAGFELDPHALVIDYEGLQLEREFYSPVYDGTNANDHTPDYRTLLFWAHDIPADAKGERRVQFFTSDKKGNYVVVVQGLSATGECGSAMFNFEVK